MKNTTHTPTTDETRCDFRVTLTRADELRLGDTFLTVATTGAHEVSVWTVRSLEVEGEDVLVNGALSTSPGNTFQVVERNG